MRSTKKSSKRNNKGTALPGIEKALPESDIRHDFVNIVRNMEDTALAFVKAHVSFLPAPSAPHEL